MEGENILILCEKPSAAERVAKALDEKGKPKKRYLNRVPHYEAVRDGRRLIVVSALGHLYTVAPKVTDRNVFPVFDFQWVPRHKADRKAEETQIWIEAISKLSEEADEYILATDYDVEGATIGYTILKYACGGKEEQAKRMKFSTLTTEDLRKSYRELSEHIEFPTVEAGTCRHFLDAMYGINLSRAMTIAAKRWSGRYAVLSTGRVQGPTLKFLVDREREINSFVPMPFWSIKAKVEIDGSVYEVEYERNVIETREEAEAVVDACRGKKGMITGIEVRKFRQKPPVPFDLGTLQSEAYSLFKYTPRRTAAVAESLYLNALISYPRTSSQKLPASINYRAILESLSRESRYRKLTEELLSQDNLAPMEGKKHDPAHPAIYPTGNLPEKPLSSSERRLWDLVVRRFMAVFGSPALKQSVKVFVAVNGRRFYLRGRQVLKEGWIVFYKPFIRSDEVLLPPLEERQEIGLKQILREDMFTKPPARYNPSSLLRKMEDRGIGTKATRAGIIDTLYSRGYVSGERATVSELGFDVTDVLDRYCPQVVSADFTKELEESMAKIQNGNEQMENVLNKAIKCLKPVLGELKSHQESVGEELSGSVRKTRMQERIVGGCPVCGTGELVILRSRRTGKRFLGCTGFFKGLCKASFPLPQKGTVKPARRSCRTCGWPMITFRTQGKQPWTFCINPDCASKEGKK
ncbi:MAG: DNA topoisomerase I [Candidatus Bathyarchaeota archaeon]|nr:DNA topoisomerase I [Candidatus Bathyarchaeota archaeon]